MNIKINLNNIEIKNHPSCSTSQKHLKLIKEIKNIISIQNSEIIKIKKFQFLLAQQAQLLKH